MWEQFNEALGRAGSRVILNVADFLPGVLAMLTTLAIALPLAWLAGFMLRRSLTRLRFDERLGQWGFSELVDWSPYGSATVFVSRIASWIIMLLGFLTGLTALDARFASTVTLRAFAYLPSLLAAATVLLVGSLIARFLARSVLISAVNMQLQSARLISLGVKWLILVLTGAMAMEHVGIGGEIIKMAFGIAFGGIVLALSLAVGLGSKEVVSRSWERRREDKEPEDQPIRHL
jgi:hypothetical protein